MPAVSVIVCTHNPRRDYLDQTLAALRAQSLSLEDWELLLVDNASDVSLAATLDLSWHRGARVVREATLGLTPARLRGIAETTAPLLVFVDDDNVLAPDYLATAARLAAEWPCLGAWSGTVVPEFEVEPPKELGPWLWTLCIREVTTDRWGNAPDPSMSPWGAGMCARRAVAARYRDEVERDQVRLGLDRVGKALGGTGDMDLAFTSLDVGLGMGLFGGLKLTHLLPARRLSAEYLLRLVEDSTASYELFCRRRGLRTEPPSSRVDRWVAGYKRWRATPVQRQFAAARARGIARARELLAAER